MELLGSNRPRCLQRLASAVTVSVGAALILAACTATPTESPSILQPVSSLPGWAADSVAESLPALHRGCRTLMALAPGATVRSGGVTTTAADWQPLCAAVAGVAPGDETGLRAVLVDHALAVAQTGPEGAEGLFTGYFTPLLDGDWRPSARYRVPLYRPPGRAEGTSLPTRAEIAAGALDGQGLELLWVDDAIDAFFLEIQGSGYVQLPDGAVVAVGFAGRNGHDYVPIGRVLIDRGEITREAMSMQAIRAWLATNPDQAQAMMNENPNVIFFAVLDSGTPLGADGRPLTAGRSLAVDRDHISLGVPLWLDVAAPDADAPRLRRMVVAQDVGSAIVGPVRGDLYWGEGDAAGENAGRMRSTGRFWALVPRAALAGG